MNNNFFKIAAVVAIAFVLVKPHLGELHIPSFNRVTAEVEVFPDKPTSSRVLDAVEPVHRILANADAQDKLNLARLWREDALIVQGDDSVIQTTADIQRANGVAGKLMQAHLKDRYSGLADAVDNAFKSVIGDDVKPLDPSTRRAVVEVFNGLSWAAHN
jgi:hypothetical protein